MPSPIEIVNLAIDHVGGNGITSFDDQSVEANLAGRQYAVSLDAVLADAEWAFAQQRKVLEKSADPLVDNAFVLPADLIRLNRVFRDQRWREEDSNLRFFLEGGLLIMPGDWCGIRYTRRDEDSKGYPPAFVEALAYHIAARMATPIARSRSLSTDLFGMYQVSLRKAVTQDGVQQQSPRVRAGTWVKSRRR